MDDDAGAIRAVMPDVADVLPDTAKPEQVAMLEQVLTAPDNATATRTLNELRGRPASRRGWGK